MKPNMYAIGIDVGGTNTCIALVSTDGKIIARDTIPTAGKSVEDFCDAIAESTRVLSAQPDITRQEICGAGIDAPCADFRTGRIEAATNLPWPSPIPIKELLEERLNMPVTVSNDANAAAVGEKIYGAGRDINDFIFITLGTGVGSGIVSEGRLISGHRGFAGELGHCSVRTPEGFTPRRCSCGRTDCLEAYCAAAGVVRTGREMLSRHGLSDNPTLTALQVGMAADRNEPWAVETLRLTGEVLGRACSDFVTFSDPEAIILFGGVANVFRHIEPSMRRALETNSLSIYQNRVKILVSGLESSDAALLGSAALAFC